LLVTNANPRSYTWSFISGLLRGDDSRISAYRETRYNLIREHFMRYHHLVDTGYHCEWGRNGVRV
jgi:hypothetical protein